MISRHEMRFLVEDVLEIGTSTLTVVASDNLVRLMTLPLGSCTMVGRLARPSPRKVPDHVTVEFSANPPVFRLMKYSARSGFALGEFEESEEDGVAVVEEFYPADGEGQDVGGGARETGVKPELVDRLRMKAARNQVPAVDNAR